MSNKLFVGLIVIIAAVVVVPLIIASQRNNESEREERVLSRQNDAQLVECLAEANVIVYGSRTCPECTRFAMQFGGYDVIDPIYVECADNPEECQANMQTKGVPEVQIDGVLARDRSKAGLAAQTGCPYDAGEEQDNEAS